MIKGDVKVVGRLDYCGTELNIAGAFRPIRL